MEELKIEGIGDITLVVVHGEQEEVFHESFIDVTRIIIQKKRK